MRNELTNHEWTAMKRAMVQCWGPYACYVRLRERSPKEFFVVLRRARGKSSIVGVAALFSQRHLRTIPWLGLGRDFPYPGVEHALQRFHASLRRTLAPRLDADQRVDLRRCLLAYLHLPKRCLASFAPRMTASGHAEKNSVSA
jgi:hypothetical protein